MQAKAATRAPDSAPAPALPGWPPGDAGPGVTHRDRLLDGMAAAIEEKGYAATTIADVVSRARVSKRTFYEHFPDKEACFLALFAATSERMLEVMAEAAAPDLPWEARIRAAAHAYLSGLAAQPALTSTYLMEIRAAGPRALALRRQVVQRFADMLRTLADEARRQNASLRPIPAAVSTAIVGGINELMLLAVEEGRARELTDLSDTATELIRAVLSAPER